MTIICQALSNLSLYYEVESMSRLCSFKEGSKSNACCTPHIS